MRFKRRGIRRETFLNPRGSGYNKTKDDPQKQKTLPMRWEEFFDSIMPLLRPNYSGNVSGLSGIYQTYSKEQQKNLTDKIAGQILFAHYDIVKNILDRLSKISLDLSQQTEVAYHRLKLVDRFF